MAEKYWQTEISSKMTDEQWESLCDGCARCCLLKLEDKDNNELHYTSVACSLLELDTCSCSDYANRTTRQPDCVKLTKYNIDKLYWMPKTCAYRRLAEGKPLNDWHPLISKSQNTVHDAGVSIRSFAVLEQGDENLEDYIIEL